MQLSSLAVPSAYVLIFFLAYSSQWLFLYLEPHPLEPHQTKVFNVLVVCLLVSYTKSVFTDPGRISKGGDGDSNDVSIIPEKASGTAPQTGKSRQRWCRKCQAVKPPRAHHCKVCKRCVPKMDHHCPWTANCVSHITFPHFIRFLFYNVSAIWYLEYFLYIRCAILWQNRNLPSYLGPNIWQFTHFFMLIIANSLSLFALTILLIRNIWCLSVNTTTIEGWEIERHKTLVRRARYFGGYLDGPDGMKIRIQSQEFPYDIGIWSNFKQGMGTGNILAWFWPFSASPSLESGLDFETNGFEDPSVSWPPPDPDRMHRKLPHGFDQSEAFTHSEAELSIEAFKRRQAADLERRQLSSHAPFRRRKFVKRLEVLEGEGDEDYASEGREDSEVEDDNHSGEEGWKNSEGERLRDFGVDEDVEFYDEEDDLPLSELLARRKMR